jgi:hypothetical protein
MTSSPNSTSIPGAEQRAAAVAEVLDGHADQGRSHQKAA